MSCSSLPEKDSTPTLYPNPANLDSNTIDQSWLTGEPCDAPCWYSLEPGQSSLDDVIAVAKKLSFIDQNSMNLNKMELSRDQITQSLGFDCKSPALEFCVGMFFSGNTLSTIFLMPNYQITFDQAVEKIGYPPDGYIMSHFSPETIGCRVTLLWVKRQMSIEYSNRLFNGKDTCNLTQHGKFPKGISVYTVTYMLPSKMKIFTEEQSYTAWNGFVK